MLWAKRGGMREKWLYLQNSKISLQITTHGLSYTHPTRLANQLPLPAIAVIPVKTINNP